MNVGRKKDENAKPRGVNKFPEGGDECFFFIFFFKTPLWAFLVGGGGPKLDLCEMMGGGFFGAQGGVSWKANEENIAEKTSPRVVDS